MSLAKRIWRVLGSQVRTALDDDSKTAPNYDFYQQDDTPRGNQDQSAQASDATGESRYRANLEVGPEAEFDEIKTSYVRLLKKYHPDRHNQDPEKRAVAETITRGLNEAMAYFEKHHS